MMKKIIVSIVIIIICLLSYCLFFYIKDNDADKLASKESLKEDQTLVNSVKYMYENRELAKLENNNSVKVENKSEQEEKLEKENTTSLVAENNPKKYNNENKQKSSKAEKNEKVETNDNIEETTKEEIDKPKETVSNNNDSSQNIQKQEISEYCVEGGKIHIAGDGENEHGYYPTWESAFQALKEYIRDWDGCNYKVDQCACGLYYFWAKQN